MIKIMMNSLMGYEVAGSGRYILTVPARSLTSVNMIDETAVRCTVIMIVVTLVRQLQW